MEITERFNFGKYYGVPLINVFKGTPIIQRTYLKAYIDFLFKDENIGNYLKLFNNSPLELIDVFEVSEDEIKLLVIYWTGNENDKEEFIQVGGNFQNALQHYLSIGNQPEGLLLGGFCSFSNFIQQQYFKRGSHIRTFTKNNIIVANPNYINWSINNVQGFFIEPNELIKLEQEPIYVFHGINVMKKEGGRYYFAPNIEDQKFVFSEKTKAINKAKYNKHYNSFNKEVENYSRGANEYCYNSWGEMAFHEAFEGDIDLWREHNF